MTSDKESQRLHIAKLEEALAETGFRSMMDTATFHHPAIVNVKIDLSAANPAKAYEYCLKQIYEQGVKDGRNAIKAELRAMFQ